MAESSTSMNEKDLRLFNEIMKAIETLEGWGSVEVFVQNNKITQITRRSIQKTELSLENRA